MQALPWIKCRKELSHPTKEQADSKAQRVRERKTPIYSFTALFSPSDLLSLPPLSYPLFLLVVSLNLSLSFAHILIQIHSYNSAHSQARVRQPHVSPCSASGWEERALQGAAITQDTGSQDLDALGQSNKIETFLQDGNAEFSFIILKSKPAEH